MAGSTIALSGFWRYFPIRPFEQSRWRGGRWPFARVGAEFFARGRWRRRVLARNYLIAAMTENAIAREIVDAAFRIHTALGPGLLESVYVTILAYELDRRGLCTVRQQAIPVVYDNVRINTGFRADMIVEDKVIVEVRSVEAIGPVHKKQLLTYLRLADKLLGLPINFQVALIKDGITRIVNGLEKDFHAKSPRRGCRVASRPWPRYRLGHKEVPVTQLRKMMLEELQRRNYSQQTTKAHIRTIWEFAKYFHRSPDELGPEHIREFQAHLFRERKLSGNSVAQRTAAPDVSSSPTRQSPLRLRPRRYPFAAPLAPPR